MAKKRPRKEPPPRQKRKSAKMEPETKRTLLRGLFTILAALITVSIPLIWSSLDYKSSLPDPQTSPDTVIVDNPPNPGGDTESPDTTKEEPKPEDKPNPPTPIDSSIKEIEEPPVEYQVTIIVNDVYEGANIFINDNYMGKASGTISLTDGVYDLRLEYLDRLRNIKKVYNDKLYVNNKNFKVHIHNNYFQKQ